MHNIQQKREDSSGLIQHNRLLYAYAISRTGDIELARDLVQETYLAALQNKGQFGQRSSARTWLTAILKNKICDAYRSKEMERRKFAMLEAEPRQEMFSDYHELMPMLKQALGQLPELWQRVFVLKNIEGRPASEICEMLRLSPANYWVISHRARQSLRESLRHYYH